MNNRIFVSGATGFQGGSIANALLSKGNEVITLSRTSESKSKNKNELQIMSGGLEDKAAIAKALENTNKAVFTLPLIFDKNEAKIYVENFIAAAEETKELSLVVFNSGFDLPKETTGFLGQDLKVEIKALFDNSNLNVITLMPDIYIDNLAAPWSIPVIQEHNILPYPVVSGQKVPWVSHTDLAKFTASAIEKPELASKTLPIGGNIVTGEEIASVISNAIGKQINFVSVAPDDFEKQLAPAFGDLAAKEISNLYRYVDANKGSLIAKDFKSTQELLGVTPQTIQDWAASINWSK
jgi:uncharacterized protein YbjT (DUF2867 family)